MRYSGAKRNVRSDSMKIILASKSPRRREILSGLGLHFDIVSADCDESSDILDPASLVSELALRKGRAVRELLLSEGKLSEDTLIIASDTVVSIDGEILGKPKDTADAVSMLTRLSGRTHRVTSGIAFLTCDKEATAFESTEVTFSSVSLAEIERYVASGEPMDKAGAYAVQGGAALWIEGLRGDYFNVVGLPVHRLDVLSREFFGCGLLDL